MTGAATRASEFRRGIEVLLFVAAFLSTWLPCFLESGLLEGVEPLSDSLAAFALALPWGCLASSAVLLLVRKLRDVSSSLWRPVFFVSLCAYAGGFVLLMLLELFSSGTVVPAIVGVATGAGIVPLSAWWCSQTASCGFSAMLLQGAICGLFVVVIVVVLGLLPSEARVVSNAALALIATGGLYCAYRRSRSEAGAVEARMGACEPRSTRDAFSVVATWAVGLVPFVLLSDLLPGVAILGFTFNASTGLLLGSLFVLAVAFVASRRRMVAPALFWVVFPVSAGVLLLLDSFPKESFASTLSAGLVFSFFSMIGVFAAVCVIHTDAQREFSSSVVVGIPFALASATAAFAGAVEALSLSQDDIGALLRVITTAYLVFLLLAPLFRARRQSGEDEKAASSAADEAAFDAVCMALADEHGLSRREHEVFDYLVRGYTSPYIAKALFISDSTVRSHTKAIYRKFEVSSRTDLIEIVRRG